MFGACLRDAVQAKLCRKRTVKLFSTNHFPKSEANLDDFLQSREVHVPRLLGT